MGSVTILLGCQNAPDVATDRREVAAVEDEPAAVQRRSVRDEAQAIGDGVGLDAAAVKRLQARLAMLGFAPGPVDGIVGAQTAIAVERYQKVHRLPVTGKASRALLKHLEANSADKDDEAPRGPNLVPEKLPQYQPETEFVYSNGEVARVVGVKDSVTQWVRRDRTSYARHRNFLLPWSYWESEDLRGTARISEDPDRLWPRHEGAEVAFSAEVTVQRKGDSDTTESRIDWWRCRNEGSRAVVVPAGAFDTVMLVCRRGAAPDAPDLVRTWYYAEDVGHHVRFVESEPGRERTESADLVAVRPGAPGWPPIARAALGRTIAHSLETRESGVRVPWTSSGVEARVTIEPRSRFVSDDGRTCRQFVQTWSESGRRRDYPAVACKAAGGGWEIPGLDGDGFDSSASPDKVL